jgi:hypothetical protein
MNATTAKMGTLSLVSWANVGKHSLSGGTSLFEGLV